MIELPTLEAFATPLQRVLYLKAIEGFEDLDTHELTAIAELMRPREFAAGEVLIQPGAPPRAIYILTEGRVLIERNGRFFRDVGPKQPSVGVMAVYAQDPEGICATAQEDTSALELPAAELFDLFEDRSHITQVVTRNVARVIYRVRARAGLSNQLRAAAYTSYPQARLNLLSRVSILRSTLAFSDLPFTVSLELAQGLKEMRCDAARVLWPRGAPGDWLGIIVWGHVDAFLDRGLQTRGGDRRTTAFV